MTEARPNTLRCEVEAEPKHTNTQPTTKNTHVYIIKKRKIWHAMLWPIILILSTTVTMAKYG